MVVRGWLPAADGITPNLAASRADMGEEVARIDGTLVSSRDGRGGQPLWVESAGARHLAIAALDIALIRDEHPLEPSVHVLRENLAERGSALRPAREADIGAGPHLSYTVQWFAFAIIILTGTAVIVLKDRKRRPA